MMPEHQTILHPTTLDAASEVAFYHALRLAAARNWGLSLLHVQEDKEADISSQDFPHVRETLARWGDPGEVVVAKLVGHHGRTVKICRDYMEEHRVSFVVLASHRNIAQAHWLQDQTAVPISRSSVAPTLFVPHGVDGFVRPENGQVDISRVLVPIASSPRPQSTVRVVGALLSWLGVKTVEVELLHVGDPGDAPSVTTLERAGWHWSCKSLPLQGGAVSDLISCHAAETGADLIAMSTAGHHGLLDLFQGSTTERVLETAPCPVLAVPEFLE